LNAISIEINLYYATKRYIANPLLWNISRSVSGQVYFSAEPVGCTWSQTETGLRLDFVKPDRKTPYKLFITLNFMNEFYSGVLYSRIPICNEEPKQNKSDIKDALELYATESPTALQFTRDLGALTLALEIDFYDEQEDLVQQLLFGNDGYIDSIKEKKFFAVFKTYSQLRKAMALIQKEYFKFDEAEAWSQLGKQSKGTFAVVFSTQNPGLLACHYKSGGVYPETKLLGYFAPVNTMPQQPYFFREHEKIVRRLITPPNEGFYQIEHEAQLSDLRICYTVDDWIADCVELKYPL
jgi:hypothetical protein